MADVTKIGNEGESQIFHYDNEYGDSGTKYALRRFSWKVDEKAPTDEEIDEWVADNFPAPSLGLTKFLADWYVWATGTQNPVDGEEYWLNRGLCANLRWCFTEELDVDATAELCGEMQDMFEVEFGTREYPFGEDAYNSTKDNAHEDPNRLAWVERKLHEAGIVAAPKWYRDFEISFEYGYYRAVHVDYEGEWDGESWVGRGMSTECRTLVGLRDEIDALLEEAK